jgi:hypothetical protein
MQGFIVFDFAKEYDTALAQLSQWLAEGKLKRKETIIKGGVAAAETALQQLFEGVNIGTFSSATGKQRADISDIQIGKLLVEVKKPEDASRL